MNLHDAICQAVAVLNTSPEIARIAEGRQVRDILRQALVDYADAPTTRTPAERRYHWLRQYLSVARESEGGWTCWLQLACIPYRSRTTDPEQLLDELIARFPLEGKDGKEPL